MKSKAVHQRVNMAGSNSLQRRCILWLTRKYYEVSNQTTLRDWTLRLLCPLTFTASDAAKRSPELYRTAGDNFEILFDLFKKQPQREGKDQRN